MSASVRLPRAATPTFPQRCIYSGEDNPDSHVTVIANAQSALLSFLFPLLALFGWVRFRVPISHQYRMRFYLETFGRDLLLIALAIAAVMIFMPMVAEGTPFRKLKVGGWVFLVMSPWLAFEVFVPRPFSATVSRDWIEYEFSSEEYAKEFQRQNLLKSALL